MTWERFTADRAKTEAEIERLRAALEREQREHANCEDYHARQFQVLTDTILTLMAQVQAMRPVVEAITVRHDGICMFCRHSVDRHSPACPVEQARAYIAQHPATGDGE